MNPIKSSFIQLAIECNVLKFGEFSLKSGRISPYFFNAGLFYSGDALKKIGEYYAETIVNSKLSYQHLFGPAYKGLPLATATAVALSHKGINTTVTFNRKETKPHGEGGQLIGAPMHGDVLIIDDVITAGTAFREAQTFIKASGGQLTGVIIALDRCERGLTHQSTLEEIRQEGIEVLSIITLFDLIDYLRQNGQNNKVKRLEAYQQQYGSQV